MAETGWWDSWVSSARNKSAEVLEFVKKDITEISSAVKCEASTIAEAVKDSLQLDKEDSTAGVVKKSLSTFFDSISDVLTPPSAVLGAGAIRDEDIYIPVVVRDGQPVELTGIQLKLHELTSLDATYTGDVNETDQQRFASWLDSSSSSAELLNNVDKLSRWLAADPILQEKYSRLVPVEVTHSDFWRRYLFRRAVLEDEWFAQEERERKRRRKKSEVDDETDGIESTVDEVEEARNDYSTPDPDAIRWDKEDFGPDVDLTEEEQIRLLTQYEQERKTRQHSPTILSPEKEKDIKIREKGDMVIVDDAESASGNVTSSSKESSTDGDWEKDFEVEDEKK